MNPADYLASPYTQPGINTDGTITLLHGTTAQNAVSIKSYGFRPIVAREVAEQIANLYGLDPVAVFNHIAFEFAKHRNDRDRVHFTSIPETAQQYTIPEVYQDALHAVWIMTNGAEHVTREGLREQQAWMRQEGARLMRPEVLAVTMPWSVVGDHAFGKRLTLEEWQTFGRIRDLHSISVPISALRDVRIVTVTP